MNTSDAEEEREPLRGRPRILRVITRLNIGGPAIQAIMLTREMQPRRYDCLLATGCCEDGEGDMSYLLSDSDPVYEIPALSRSVSPLRNLKALWALWRLIRESRPDIVHTHTAMAGTLGRTAAFLGRVPVVIHTFHGNSLRQYFSPAASAFFLAIERLLARRTDVICVISPQQLGELSSGFRIAPQSKCRIVPLGLDLSSFLQLAPPAPADLVRVGWFGRLVEVKNIALLLEVIAVASKSKWQFEFHIAGDGPDRCRIEAALPSLSRHLIWHGWQRDVTPILEACDVLVQTSRNEGTPVALIQGMAAARPFISTAVGGVVDMTCGPGRNLTPGARWFDNAILVDPRPETFIQALDELASNHYRIVQMGEAARAFAASHFRKEALIENLDALYRELLERKAPHLVRSNRFAATQA